MSDRPVRAVVVAYHAPDALDRALAGLAGHLPITVVDNSQSEAVRAVCRARGATYLVTRENVGFAAAVNAALRVLESGPACDVLLLNPDAVVAPAEVAELAAALHDDERAAAVAPRLVDETGTPQRALWPFPSPGQAWLDAVGLGRLGRGGRFAIGAVLLLRWEALRDVGLFDERFFLYAEEADWQRRALSAGWHARFCPRVTALHAGGGTSNDPALRERLFHAAQETYIRKWFGTRGWLLYRAAAAGGAGLRAVVPRRGRRREAARRMCLYVRGPRRVAALEGAESLRHGPLPGLSMTEVAGR